MAKASEVSVTCRDNNADRGKIEAEALSLSPSLSSLFLSFPLFSSLSFSASLFSFFSLSLFISLSLCLPCFFFFHQTSTFAGILSILLTSSELPA